MGSFNNKLLWTWNSEDVANVLGYSFEAGLFFDNSKLAVSNPFESQKLHDFLLAIHHAKENGYIGDGCLFSDSSNNYGMIMDNIQNKQFGVLFTRHTKVLDEMKDKFIIFDLPFSPHFARNGGTNGISAKSTNAEAAFRVLSLLHTNDEMAHILLYGGDEKHKTASPYLIDNLGIYRSSYSENEGSVYDGNVRELKKKVYRSALCKPSAFMGFQVDTAEFSDEDKANMDTVGLYFDVWTHDDFEDSYQMVSDEIGRTSKNIIAKMKRQVEKWNG